MEGKCLFLAVIVVFVLKASRSEPLTDVLTAVRNVIGYYDSNYKNINLDGLFGLRVLEGQLQVLLAEIQSGHIKNVSTTVVHTLQASLSSCTRLSRISLAYTEKDDPAYYRLMAFVVDQPWTLTGDVKRINTEYKWDAKVYKIATEFSLDEQTSDMCMSELTGAGSKRACDISDKCVRIMTFPGLTGYGITHQVLWTMLAEKAGCLDSLQKVLSKTPLQNLSRMREEYCANNYYEMKMLVDDYHHHSIPPIHQDLFMEQQFICASIGFVEFLSLEYLQWILSWQKDSGCYGKMERIHDASRGKVPFKVAMEMDVEDYYQDSDKEYPGDEVEIDGNSNKQIVDKKHKKMSNQKKKDFNFHENKNLKSHVNNTKSKAQLLQQLDNQADRHNKDDQLKFVAPERAKRNVGNARGLLWYLDPVDRTGVKDTRRKLLAEKDMRDGCLSHKTAVAAGALMIYLKYLILAQDSMQNITITHQYSIIHEATNSRSLLNNVNNGQVDQKQLIQQDKASQGEEPGNVGYDHEIMPQQEADGGDNVLHKYRDDVVNNNDPVDDFPLKRINIPKDPDEKLYQDYQNQEGNVLHGGDRDGMKVNDVNKEDTITEDEDEEEYYEEDEDDYDDEDDEDDETYEDDDTEDDNADDSKVAGKGHGKLKSSRKSHPKQLRGNFKDEYYDDNGDEGLDDNDNVKNGDSVRKHDGQTNSNNDEYTYYEDVEHKNRPMPHIKNKKRKAVKFAESMNIPVKLENVKVITHSNSRTSYIIIFVMTLILLFLFVRFIRKRRIHIRYSTPSFLKL